MKISTLVICSLLFCCQYQAKSQSLAPSTVRQIFNFEKGDSLEYYAYTLETMEGCGMLCDIYRLNIIDSTYYNTTTDTLFIAFTSQTIHADTFTKAPSYNCDDCHPGFIEADYFVLNSGLWIVTVLDSSIKYLMDTIYGSIYGWGYDTVYKHPNQYNGKKQNEYDYDERVMSSFTEIYIDSLGIVYKTEEDGTATNNTEQLIYYHKVNGKFWGAPYINTGIENIYSPYNIKVYPNPVSDRFVINTSLFPGVRFELFDVLSKRVISINLTGTETEVNRNNLPPGVYFWQATTGESALKAGILVLQ